MEPESARIHTGRVSTSPSTKTSFMRGVPGVDSSIIVAMAESNTGIGDCS